MEEIQTAENKQNGVGGGGGGGGNMVVGSSETVGSKRQRRPSVRLGDIGGDQAYESHVRRSNKQWKHPQQFSSNKEYSNNNSNSNVSVSAGVASGKGSKIRTLLNLSNETLEGGGGGGEEKESNLDSVAIGSWRVKDSKKRGSNTKRVRSNWVSKVDEGGGGGCGGEGDEKYSGGDDIDDGYREFDVENSESPLKEQSPIHSLENLGVEGHGNESEMVYRRSIRGRVNENREQLQLHHDGVEFSGPSDTEGRDWKCGTSGDRIGNGGGRGRCGEDGVRIWLNGLGLGRYAPVFEIHEVDDEVLPMLTLEDLKDMGINAVGSRRKMFCAIQKLGKGFS